MSMVETELERLTPRASLQRIGRRPSPRRRWVQVGLGLVCAALAFELLFRILTTQPGGETHDWGVTIKQYDEGVSSASFAWDNARLTDNPVIPGAAYGLIVGDSYVQALQLNDGQTVGSILERRLRQSGDRINIRQYGWPGASAPMYCYMSANLLAKWSPSWVLVMLSDNDMTVAAVKADHPVQFSFRRDGTVALAGHPEPESTMFNRPSLPGSRWAPPSVLDKVFEHSGLYSNLKKRVHQVVRSAGAVPGAGQPSHESGGGRDNAWETAERVPGTSVHMLKRAFGTRLIIGFDRNGDDQRSRHVEDLVFQACRQDGVRCLDMYSSIKARGQQDHRFVRGFAATSPETGHYNSFGHQVLADVLYPALAHH